MQRELETRQVTGGDRQAITRWRNAIIAAFGIGGITVASWGPRLPAIEAELGVGTGTLGLVLACATVGSLVGLVCARLFLHHLGGRGAVIATVLVVAAALVVMGVGMVSSSVGVVAVGFVIVGFGTGALDVSINVEGAAVERVVGRTLMPLMHAAWSGGVAVGAGIGALCAATGVTPAAQFIGLAVFVTCVGLVMSRDIPLEAPPESEAGAVAARWPDRIRRWFRGWTDRRLLLIGLVLLGVEFGQGSANSWLALAAKRDHGQSGAVAALFLALFAVSEASARTFGGPVVDRLGRVRVIRYTTALGIAGVTLFILGDAVWIVVVGVALWAVGVSMGFPLGLSAAAEGGDPATQVSVAASVGYFANLLGPPLIGFLAESLGLLHSLWSLPIFFLAAFAAAGSLRPLAADAAPGRSAPL